jgi:hypothetical protein
MSGDSGLHEQPIVFYHRKMTEAKRILLQHKGIRLEYIRREEKIYDSKSNRSK